MTLLDQIEKQLRTLPPEKQSEALDFILFLAQQSGASRPAKRHPLKKHAAFGSWKHRKIDAVLYQRDLRAEWGGQMIAVFDTNIVIDALNGVESADMEYSRYERILIN